MIDEAYRVARSGGDTVRKWENRGITYYDVDMGRPIGFVGGRVRGRPPTRHIRLSVVGEELRTAYPFRPMNRTAPNPDDYTARRDVPEVPNELTTRELRAQGLGVDERNEIARRDGPWTRLVVPNRGHANKVAESMLTVARRLREAYGDVPLAASIARRAAPHIATGMPTAAGRGNANDYLIARTGYVLSYNRERRVPNWVGLPCNRRPCGKRSVSLGGLSR